VCEVVTSLKYFYSQYAHRCDCGREPLISLYRQDVYDVAKQVDVFGLSDFHEALPRHVMIGPEHFEHSGIGNPIPPLQPSSKHFCIHDLGQVQLFRVVAQLFVETKKT
jgi:hypothetical protein